MQLRRAIYVSIAVGSSVLGWQSRGFAQTCQFAQITDGSNNCNTPPSPLYDTSLKVVDAASASAVRSALINEIWGSSSIPAPAVTTVTPDALHRLSPGDPRLVELTGLIAQLSNGTNTFSRVDMLEYQVKEGSTLIHTALGWHFIAANNALTKHKVVIVHQGHDSTLIDPNPPGADGHLGLARTINALLLNGYSVVGMYMPGKRPGDTTGSDHIALVYSTPITTGGSPIKFFMTPISVFLNYVKTQSAAGQFSAYTNFYMVGLSGGGWSTTVYAAIDPTIEYSFPVAGSVPFFMRCDHPDPGGACGTPRTPNCEIDGDAEETYTDLYQHAGYPDLYVLGSYGVAPNGVPRHQTQVLNRNDDGAYGTPFYHLSQPANPPWDVAINCYEQMVRNRLYQLGRGMFRAEIDENMTTVSTVPPIHHMVSTGAIYRTILGELNDARRMIGRQNGNSGNPSNNDAFYRGINGHLYHNSIANNFEEDTGIQIVGVPDAAWVSGQSSQKAFNVIARDIHDTPILISTAANRGGWSSQPFSGQINNDPTIISGQGSGQLWTFALGTDYLPYVWDASGNHLPVSNQPGLGPISASLRGVNQGFHVYYLRWDGAIQHAYRSSSTMPWQNEVIDGNAIGFPTGTVAANGDLYVFDIGTDGMLYYKMKASGDQTPSNPWTGWNSISSSAGKSSTVITGTPSFSIGSNNAWSVFVVLPSRDLAVFTASSPTSTWTFADLGGLFVGPPTSHWTGAFIRGRSTGLYTWKGSGTPTFVGGFFD